MKAVVALLLLQLAAIATASKLSRSHVELKNGVPQVKTEFIDSSRTPSRNAGRKFFSPQAGLKWHQHEETSIYNHVAISSKGYIAASTFLNPPEMVEIYKITGDAVTHKAGDVDPNHDQSSDVVALARDGTTCVGMIVFRSNFSTALVVWDLEKTSSKPEYHHIEPATIGVTAAVSTDGSITALMYYADVTYLRPNTMGITLLSAQAEVLVKYRGRTHETPLVMGMSGDGHYVAYVSQVVSEEKRQLNLTVVEYVASTKSFGERFSIPIQSFSQHIAVSQNGEYIAMAGLLDDKLVLDVYHKAASSTKLSYTPHALPSPEDFFLINLAFSPEGYSLATTWAARTLHQNQLIVFDLPSQKATYKYLYPVDTGDKLQDEPVAVAISSNGEYVAVASWGTPNHTAGTEQIQVFKVGVDEPILKQFTPGSMFGVDIMKMETGVYVVAAGKAVPANQFGNGGDLYVFEVSSPGRAGGEPLDLNTPVNDRDMIARINSKNAGWTAGVNEQFEGMKLSDVKGHFGTNLINLESIAKLPSDPARAKALPEAFDSRKEWPTCIHPIRNQGRCGSCWAFSATESLSDRMCIASDKKVDVILSPEYLVECDQENNGCGGGWLVPAWDFMESKGVPVDACYPYVAINGSAGHCQPKCTSKTAGSFTRYHAKAKSIDIFKSVEEMQESIMKYGPIQAGFTVWSDFMAYKSGVYKQTSGAPLGGHGIKIVGWGVQSTTEEKYWIIANSWGATWGDLEGYFWFQRGTDQCLMESNSLAGQADVPAL